MSVQTPPRHRRAVEKRHKHKHFFFFNLECNPMTRTMGFNFLRGEGGISVSRGTPDMQNEYFEELKIREMCSKQHV